MVEISNCFTNRIFLNNQYVGKPFEVKDIIKINQDQTYVKLDGFPYMINIINIIIIG